MVSETVCSPRLVDISNAVLLMGLQQLAVKSFQASGCLRVSQDSGALGEADTASFVEKLGTTAIERRLGALQAQAS